MLLFGGLMGGVVVYPMWKTDWAVLSVARDTKVGANLSDILKNHPGFTYVMFHRQSGGELCFTAVNVDGRLKVLTSLKNPRPAPEPFDLARTWSMNGRCARGTVVYEGLYRKGYVYVVVNDRLDLTDEVNVSAGQ